MSIPRVKRPYNGAASDPAQRQITSFFARNSDDSPSFASSTSCTPSRQASPLLPPSIQSNLLSVGMRVRKSVPEGYKTGKEENALYGRRAAPVSTATVSTASPVVPASALSVRRELQPFCGIHSVGGLGVQFAHEAAVPAATLAGGPDSDDVPSLTSSQQTMSSFGDDDDKEPLSRKRYSREDEDEDAAHEPAPASAAYYQLGRRVLAVPRRRHQRQQEHQLPSKAGHGSVRVVDQENAAAGDDDCDFSEAEFLDASAWAAGRDLDMDM